MSKPETRIFCSYLHCKPDGTPFYVGKGTLKRSRDFWNGRNRHHKFIVLKYGKENILVYAFQCESEQEAFDDEIHQIAQLRREGYMLANICDGGEGQSGRTLSPEHKKAIGRAAKGNSHAVGYKRSDELKYRIGQLNKLDDRRAKNSAANIGRSKPPVTDSHKRNISMAMKGKPWSIARREAQLKRGIKL